MSARDGGPAFPRPYSTNGTAEDGPEPGMTLRDYFAGQALAGAMRTTQALAEAGGTVHGDDVVAEIAYGIADAMIAERSKP